MIKYDYNLPLYYYESIIRRSSNERQLCFIRYSERQQLPEELREDGLPTTWYCCIESTGSMGVRTVPALVATILPGT